MRWRQTVDNVDRCILDRLQGGFPVEAEPFRTIAGELGLDTLDLIARIARLRDQGVISRFGPLYHAERMGGTYLLAAMRVPEEDFERVATAVNAHPEVAHNYRRQHIFSMWFVVAAQSVLAAQGVVTDIERETGYRVFPMPKEREFFVGLRLSVREAA